MSHKKKKKKQKKPAATTTATRRVWIGFRDYQPEKDARVNLFSVFLTGSRICHVELILLKECLGGVACPWRRKNCACPTRTEQHLVSFSIASRPGSTGVYRDIDRNYHQEGAWTFLELIKLDPQQVARLERFANFHHAKKNRRGYNSWGFYCNFVLPTELGMLKRRSGEPRRLQPRPWFCTELISACLDYAGIPIATHPCQTMPCQLYHYLVDHRIARFDPHYSVVGMWNEDDDEDLPNDGGIQGTDFARTDWSFALR